MFGVLGINVQCHAGEELKQEPGIVTILHICMEANHVLEMTHRSKLVEPEDVQVFVVIKNINLEGVLSLVDGNWNGWSEWSACSVTCGGGEQQRSRACNNPAKQFDGEECSGDVFDTRICNSFNCPG